MGNWDWFTHTQTWLGIGGTQGNPLGSPQAIPNSLYLSSKPTFFGSNPWPWVDPSTGSVYTLPAKARFHTFRSNKAASHDFDGDGKSDIALADGSGNTGVWLMNGVQVTPAGVGAGPAGWSIVGQRDFNGDGKADLLWRDTSGNVGMWFMNGAQATPAGVGNISTGWSVAGTGDFNGDGKGDVLGQDPSGRRGEWVMNGAKVTPAGVGHPP